MSVCGGLPADLDCLHVHSLRAVPRLPTGCRWWGQPALCYQQYLPTALTADLPVPVFVLSPGSPQAADGEASLHLDAASACVCWLARSSHLSAFSLAFQAPLRLQMVGPACTWLIVVLLARWSDYQPLILFCCQCFLAARRCSSGC
jgi:hypothetical protein